MTQEEEAVARLNESLKSELEEKEASNAQYRKMMVSQQSMGSNQINSYNVAGPNMWLAK